MLYREIMAVCSEIHTKHINTLCGQNVVLLNILPAKCTTQYRPLSLRPKQTNIWPRDHSHNMPNYQLRHPKYFVCDQMVKGCICGKGRDRTRENAERNFLVRVGTDVLKVWEIRIYTEWGETHCVDQDTNGRITWKVQLKFHPRTGHEGPERG